MAHQPARKVKPVVPPKPTHLGVSEKRLPKPPDKLVDVNEFEVHATVKTKNATSGGCSSYGDDGYLKPVGEKSIGGELSNKPVKNEEPENFCGSVSQRPLPLLPGEKGENVTSLPWFRGLDRREAEVLVAQARDGTFLIRPSSKGQQSYALTLWYNSRTYNIPIRRRPDGKFALGTPKEMEQSFQNIEALIWNYQREELVLFSNGVETGRTLLYPIV